MTKQFRHILVAIGGLQRAPKNELRKVAALLGLSYRRLPDGSFDHSLLITLLDRQGRVLSTTTTLVDDSQFQAKLQAATTGEGP